MSYKKVFSVISRIITIAIFVFATAVMVFTILSATFLNRDDRSLFGTKAYIVQSDSMSPSENNTDVDIYFSVGDIIFVKEQSDYSELQSGTVISFISQGTESFGETVTHMIKDVIKDNNGKLVGYVTYGTNTGAIDESIVEPEYILGVYSGKIPKVGFIFQFFKTTPGYICCIFVPFALLILFQGLNCVRLFRRYKKEQSDSIQAERDALNKEREEMQNMMKQLLEMQKSQEQSSQVGTTPVPQSDSKNPTELVPENTSAPAE